jgi:hypothetical protein
MNNFSSSRHWGLGRFALASVSAALGIGLPLVSFASLIDCNASSKPCGAAGDCGGAGGATTSTATGTTLNVAIDASFAGIPACPADAAVDAAALPTDASTGCEGLEGGIDYATQVAPILLSSCGGELCHARWTAATLVNRPATECCDGRLLTAPGNAAQSYMLNKVTGQDLCAGSQMPFGGPYLPDADILTLQRWVCEGAPGN